MMRELAQSLAGQGHSVTVATCWPNSRFVPAGADLSVFKTVEKEAGVTVLRVKTLPGYGRHYFIRGLAQLLMPRSFMTAVRRYADKPIDRVIVYSPPLPLALVGERVKKEYGAKFILNIQDIFPQNAIDLGILKNPLLIRFFEDMERRVYAASDRMSSHTVSSVRFLIASRGVPEKKISYIPNWIDTGAFSSSAKAVDHRGRMGLQGKFVFLFSGVMGPAQGLDLVLDIAASVRDLEALRFVFLGDGSEKKRLSERAEREQLGNVLFYPYVSAQEYPSLVSQVADVGLVVLSMKNKTPVIPGKLLGFMAESKPVAAFLHKESDAHELIRMADCGFSAWSDNAKHAARLVREIYAQREELDRLGDHGRVYVAEHFSKEAVLKQLLEFL
jgi:glycosyltransferase involved in cell wall biosynthesis